MELGNQIKAHRAALSLSQEELAEKVYVTRQTVSNWETSLSLFRAKRSKCSSDRQPPPHEKSSVPAKPDGAVTSEYISKCATGCHSVFSIRRGVRPIWLCVAAFRRFCQNMRF